MKNIISGILNISIIAGVASAALAYPPEQELTFSAELDSKQVECLALNIYHEARGEDYYGQLAVAEVTINRKNHSYWPDTICEVVWQPGKFSWTNDGKSDRPKNYSAWAIAQIIARHALISEDKILPENVVFYHADRITPYWVNHSSIVEYEMVDNHIFYTWSGNWN